MKLNYTNEKLTTRKKLFPGLGSINKNMYRKGKTLKIALGTINTILNKFIDQTYLKEKDSKFLNEIGYSEDSSIRK